MIVLKKTRYDWIGKVIHWELCKKLKVAILPNSICSNKNHSKRIR